MPIAEFIAMRQGLETSIPLIIFWKRWQRHHKTDAPVISIQIQLRSRTRATSPITRLRIKYFKNKFWHFREH